MNKKRSQNIHAKRRALERHNINLNRKVRQEVISDIQNGNARFLGRYSNTRSLFLVNIEGKEVKVVYDKLRKNIATVLSEDMK